MALILSQRRVGPVTLLELGERLTIENTSEMRDTIQALMDQGHRWFLLDCGRIKVVDSQGIGTLVSHWLSLKKRGGKMELLTPSARLQEVLCLVGLQKVIESFDDIGQSLRAF
jgi:anti-anti-sigma factor